ncbi:MAG: 5-oxoprolinase subunit PxpA [Acidimicrobiales bacterium]
MTGVDLNADLAEGETFTASDRAVLAEVTSASLACGLHAGNPAVMQATAAACLDGGVTIGAHVSFRDREGFGRRPVRADPAAVVADIVEQVSILSDAIATTGATPSYLKPHGALYHQMGSDPAVAAAVVEAATRTGLGVVLAQPASAVIRPASDAGLTLVPEGYPDRGYQADGRLVPRGEPGALVDDPEEVGRRALSLARRGGLESVEGSWTPVAVATLCVHGDAPGAAGNARAVRAALESSGVSVRPFTADRPPPTRDQSP